MKVPASSISCLIEQQSSELKLVFSDNIRTVAASDWKHILNNLMILFFIFLFEAVCHIPNKLNILSRFDFNTLLNTSASVCCVLNEIELNVIFYRFA